MEINKEDRFFYGWVVMAACFIVLTIAIGTRYSFGVFFKALEEDFGLTRSMTSGIFSIHMIISCVGAVCGGWALDRYGPKIVGVLMGFFTGLSLLLASHAVSVWHLYACYGLLLALGTMAAFPTAAATTSRWFIKKRGIALGIVSSGASVGILVMTPVAAYLIDSYGWRSSYFVMSFIAWIFIVGASLLLRKEPSEIGVLPDGETETLNVSEIGSMDQQNKALPQEISLTQAVRTRSFWLIMPIICLFALCFHMVLTHLVRYAIDLDISPMRAAAVLTYMAGFNILGRLFGGKISDKVKKKGLAIVSALVQVGAMLWLIGSVNILMLYLFIVVYGFSAGLMDPLLLVLLAEIFGLRNIGVIMGIQSLFWGIGASIGPSLAGYIFDINGSYALAFLTGSISMLLAAACFFMLEIPKPIARIA